MLIALAVIVSRFYLYACMCLFVTVHMSAMLRAPELNVVRGGGIRASQLEYK